MATSELKPFRDYSEYNVINLYKFHGTILPTLVRLFTSNKVGNKATESYD